jgi:hypothetical protein
MTQKTSSYRKDAADERSVSRASAPNTTSPRLDPMSGPAFFGTAPRANENSTKPRHKIDAQEFWRRLDP